MDIDDFIGKWTTKLTQSEREEFIEDLDELVLRKLWLDRMEE